MHLYTPKRAKLHKKKLPSGEVGKLPIYGSLRAMRKNHGDCGYWEVILPRAKGGK